MTKLKQKRPGLARLKNSELWKIFWNIFFVLIKGAAEPCEGQKWPKKDKRIRKKSPEDFFSFSAKILIRSDSQTAQIFLQGCKI